VFMSHLCHDCRACYYACMYTPPHEFAINLPSILSEVRVESYQEWSWPSLLGRSFTDRRVSAALIAGTFALVLMLSLVLTGPAKIFTRHGGPGAFYAVIPFLAMLLPSMALSLYTFSIWLNGGWRFLRAYGNASRVPVTLSLVATTIRNALTLEWLRGGGPGCYYPRAEPSSSRRIYHSLVVLGFMCALLSTTLAAIYQDILQRLPPYALLSAPVIAGTLGGVLIVVGVFGLLLIKRESDPSPAGASSPRLDYAFLITLGSTALSGLVLLAVRHTVAMGSLLVIHLAFTAAFFVTAPYGKFVHSVYRTLAILVYNVEKTRNIRNSKSN
jgi:citrate/tricarballylate utilization protein